MKFCITLVLILSVLVCLNTSLRAAPSEKKSQAAPPPSSVPGPAAVSSIKGTVLETMDAAGYTYMRLKTANGEVWAAVQKTTVKKGAEVTVINAIPMDGFESKTLNRKFEHIVFGSLNTGTGAASGVLAPSHGAQLDEKSAVSAQHAGLGASPADMVKIEVKKAEGSQGKTVAEIYAGKAALKEKTVAVRGKVVKYNPGIMGKNWIHLRDGSGSPEKKNNDLAITTKDSAALGDIIVVTGPIHLDRDFGAGYIYPVIIEDAKVSK